MSIKDVVPKNRKVKIAHESLDEGVKHVSKFKPIFDLDEMYELVDVEKNSIWQMVNQGTVLPADRPSIGRRWKNELSHKYT
ncbi:MAG: hypothetical protein IJ172_00035 [Ruminococcus sp.]|nr:hypothetical protein [Ruminococcus sp.]